MSQASRPIHPQISLPNFAPKKASTKLVCETTGADPGESKIKIDATTIGKEASDAATHLAKAISRQAIAAITIGPQASAAITIAPQASGAITNDETTTVR
jgi:hypothetical protein